LTVATRKPSNRMRVATAAARAAIHSAVIREMPDAELLRLVDLYPRIGLTDSLVYKLLLMELDRRTNPRKRAA
jgi:hypothetical protein